MMVIMSDRLKLELNETWQVRSCYKSNLFQLRGDSYRHPPKPPAHVGRRIVRRKRGHLQPAEEQPQASVRLYSQEREASGHCLAG